MKIINYVICFFPYVLIFFCILLINNLIKVIQKKDKLNVPIIISIVVIIISLAGYYSPKTKILAKYDFTYIHVSLYEGFNTVGKIEFEDNNEIKKILNVINSHSFTRSAIRSVTQQNIADEQLLILSTSTKEYGQTKIIHLYVLGDNKMNSALQINDQIYNVKDKVGLSEDIFNLLKELKEVDD